MLTNGQLQFIFYGGVITYAFATNDPKPRNELKYLIAKFGAGVASVSFGMIAVNISGIQSFWKLAIALLLGQIMFKVFEDRCDRLARIYC